MLFFCFQLPNAANKFIWGDGFCLLCVFGGGGAVWVIHGTAIKTYFYYFPLENFARICCPFACVAEFHVGKFKLL